LTAYVLVVDHPLAQTRLTAMRNAATDVGDLDDDAGSSDQARTQHSPSISQGGARPER
jgi:hypothetical protein